MYIQFTRPSPICPTRINRYHTTLASLCVLQDRVGADKSDTEALQILDDLYMNDPDYELNLLDEVGNWRTRRGDRNDRGDTGSILSRCASVSTIGKGSPPINAIRVRCVCSMNQGICIRIPVGVFQFELSHSDPRPICYIWCASRPPYYILNVL